MDDTTPESAKIAELSQRILEVVGPAGLIDQPQDMEGYLREWRGRFVGKTPFVVRPKSTDEVSRVVALAADAGVPIVPQGGNTGLVAGSIPFEEGREIILSLSRMNRIRDLDAENFTITVEAGCVLQAIQDAAEEADRLFPLSLGAEGQCQIGGNLSTNAGGLNVIRYGNARDLVLGLEVVLPDGRVWNGLRRLRKDNTGYDLKQLFIGAEGTLGVITAAVLKLFARPRQRVTAFVGLESPKAALELLARTRASSAETVTSFELIPRIAIDLALKHVEGVVDPLGERQPWYVLLECAGGQETENGGLRDSVEEMLGRVYEDGIVADATLAANEGQAQAFWFLREAIVEAQRHEGGSIKHDVSVPVSSVPDFLAKADARIQEIVPGARPVSFGHLGDGNIHYNVMQPEAADTQAYLAGWDGMNAAVHDIVESFDGSISAEHGIGRMKVAENRRLKSELELELMRRVKDAFDPQGLMNPGKVLDSPDKGGAPR
jgi:FAD/FMN-containing dehydrogenase